MIFSIITADEKIIVYHQIQLLKKDRSSPEKYEAFQGRICLSGRIITKINPAIPLKKYRKIIS